MNPSQPPKINFFTASADRHNQSWTLALLVRSHARWPFVSHVFSFCAFPGFPVNILWGVLFVCLFLFLHYTAISESFICTTHLSFVCPKWSFTFQIRGTMTAQQTLGAPGEELVVPQWSTASVPCSMWSYSPGQYKAGLDSRRANRSWTVPPLY